MARRSGVKRGGPVRREKQTARPNPGALDDLVQVVGIVVVVGLAWWGYNVYKIVNAPASAFQPGGRYYTGP